MFEGETNPNQNSAQQGPVEDIFSHTDTAQKSAPAAPGAQGPLAPPSALSQGKLQPVSGTEPLQAPVGQTTGASTGPAVKKVIVILVICVVLAGGSVFAYSWMKNNDQLSPAVATPIEQVQTAPQATTDAVQSEIPIEENRVNSVNEFQQRAQDKALNPFGGSSSSIPLDTDQDGLTDEKEFEIGTNPRLVDSDNDGLSDWEEATIFKTDPLNSDTDNDGYTDGEEVQNGYDPNGPGKLLDFDKARAATTQ